MSVWSIHLSTPKIFLFSYYNVDEIIFRSDVLIYLPLRLFSSIFAVLKKYLFYLICQSFYPEIVLLCFSSPEEITFLSDLFLYLPLQFLIPCFFKRDWNYLLIWSNHLSTPEIFLFCYHSVDDIIFLSDLLIYLPLRLCSSANILLKE